MEAINIFHKCGGTHAILCHMPYSEVQITSGRSFQESYDITLKMAEKCNSETPVKIFTAVGPYPVLFIGLAEKHGIKKAVEIMKEGMESAQKLVLERKSVAIGEIGRPHFEVSAEILEASNEIMAYGMLLAKEAGCPVILHTETGTPESMKDLARIADGAGLPRSHVVKHYSPPLILEEENFGLFPSVLSTRPAISEALEKGTRFVMETDYMDEPSRPGAVLDIKTVPKRTMGYINSKMMTEEQAWIIHKDNPEKLYGISLNF